eukprot:2606931-Lingulodinium_polyedra.AAC.1
MALCGAGGAGSPPPSAARVARRSTPWPRSAPLRPRAASRCDAARLGPCSWPWPHLLDHADRLALRLAADGLL